jgi:nucleoid-associated protein YgaU
MAAAAVVAVLLLALLIWFTLRPASAPPTGGQTAATGGSVGGTQPGTQTGAPGQVGAAGTAGQAATTATPGGAKPEVAIRTTHEVKAGQSLWRISRIYYELGSQWRKIFNANQDRIKNPDLIYPKQKFKIPQ